MQRQFAPPHVFVWTGSTDSRSCSVATVETGDEKGEKEQSLAPQLVEFKTFYVAMLLLGTKYDQSTPSRSSRRSTCAPTVSCLSGSSSTKCTGWTARRTRTACCR